MSKLKDIKEYFQGIGNAILGKKEKTISTPIEWLSIEEQAELKKLKEENIKVITLPKIRFPKIRFSFTFTWLKGKRFLAGLLFLFDIAAFVTSLSSLENMIMGVFFILHGLILIDYLYKTKRRVLYRKELEEAKLEQS